MPFSSYEPDPAVPSSVIQPADIRLIVTDLDGTLLDDAGQAPRQLGRVLAQLRRRGVLFSPASGRQYAALARHFAGSEDGMVFGGRTAPTSYATGWS
jgi:hypothetical protein